MKRSCAARPNSEVVERICRHSQTSSIPRPPTQPRPLTSSRPTSHPQNHRRKNPFTPTIASLSITTGNITTTTTNHTANPPTHNPVAPHFTVPSSSPSTPSRPCGGGLGSGLNSGDCGTSGNGFNCTGGEGVGRPRRWDRGFVVKLGLGWECGLGGTGGPGGRGLWRRVWVLVVVLVFVLLDDMVVGG